MPFTLATFPFSWDTPGILDPADNGVELGSVPAGSFAEAFVVLTTDFDQLVEVVCFLGPDTNTNGPEIFDSTSANSNSDPTTGDPQLLPRSEDVLTLSTAVPRAALANVPCKFLLAIYSQSTPPTAGAGLLVTKVYS